MIIKAEFGREVSHYVLCYHGASVRVSASEVSAFAARPTWAVVIYSVLGVMSV